VIEFVRPGNLRLLDKLQNEVAPRLWANETLAYNVGRYRIQISASGLALTTDVNRASSLVLAGSALIVNYTDRNLYQSLPLELIVPDHPVIREYTDRDNRQRC